MGVQDAERYRENWQDEVDSAALYRAMAEGTDGRRAEIYRRLADVEERHAAFWGERLARAGVAAGPARPSVRARVLAFLARRVGADLVLPIVAADETRNQGMYDDQPEAGGTSLAADERAHARTLQSLAGEPGGGGIARREGRHRSVGGNALRAAVLGANDGLVSNLSLVMGVAGALAGAALEPQVVVIAGWAGLLAGASSMAIGEWVSVQSAREAGERELRVEAREIAEMPEEEAEELHLLYEAKGLPPDQAGEVAARLMADPDRALDAMAREELGLDPDELGGSPWTAAGTSFLLFAVGAVVPVLPFLFLSGTAAVGVSVAASGLALFALGAAITLFTGRSVWFSGARQLLVGLVAAGLTYGVGALLGVTVAG